MNTSTSTKKKITKTFVESRYWHYRTNDLSLEHYAHLKEVVCEWSFIGIIEVGELEKGEHYHMAVKFPKSIREGSVMKQLCSPIENKDNRNASWYLEPKYALSSPYDFIKYVIKDDFNNLRHGDMDILEDFKDADEERKTKILEAQEAKKEKKEAKSTKAEEAQERKDELAATRLSHAAIGDVDWFRKYDSKYMCGADFSRLLVWAQPDATQNLEQKENYFIYGDSGLGKSSSIDFLYPDAFRKITSNEKWDSYYNLKPSRS